MDFDTTVRLAVMDAFLAGGVPSVARIARDLHATDDAVAEAFDRLAASRAIVLAPGSRNILMAAPFAGVATAFQVDVDGKSLYANCIWDSLGVAAVLEGQGRSPVAKIETQCPDCSAPLRIDVRDGRVTVDPPSAVVHFAVPASRWWADIVFT